MKASRLLQILGVTLGLSAYSAWVQGERERSRALTDVAASSGGVPLLRRPEAEALWRDGRSIFLDVRAQASYETGHISGAVLFPEEEIEVRLPALRTRLERAKALVIYCGSENCGKSLWAAIRLRNAGLSQVRIYPAGWNDWQRHDLPGSFGTAP